MANDLQVDTSTPVAGLGTFVYTTTVTGIYTLDCQSTLPNNSALQIVLKKNSSTLITAGGATANPTPTQPTLGARTQIQCTAGDTVSVVLSSANNIDTQPNSVKSMVNLFFGE